ncbi:MAG: F0F1 ATP synthase subunit B [Clostridium perfringens]|nr:F0F1 ATP synthase subunit B [Clostridium perfringens]
MSINWFTVIATIINFLITVAVLKHFFFNKIKDLIKKRQEDITQQIREADENAEKARKLRIDNENLLKSAREEGKKITEEQKKRADKLYEEIVDNAQKDAKSVMEKAKAEMGRERDKAQQELKQQTVQLALMMSSKILNETIDEEKHRGLIDEFISKVGI